CGSKSSPPVADGGPYDTAPSDAAAPDGPTADDARADVHGAGDASPAGCQPLTAKADATNTGVPSGTALTVVDGDQTFSTNGAVVADMDFHGFVKVTGSGIT